jgi:hypothetical protein
MAEREVTIKLGTKAGGNITEPYDEPAADADDVADLVAGVAVVENRTFRQICRNVRFSTSRSTRRFSSSDGSLVLPLLRLPVVQFPRPRPRHRQLGRRQVAARNTAAEQSHRLCRYTIATQTTRKGVQSDSIPEFTIATCERA